MEDDATKNLIQKGDSVHNQLIHKILCDIPKKDVYIIKGIFEDQRTAKKVYNDLNTVNGILKRIDDYGYNRRRINRNNKNKKKNENEELLKEFDTFLKIRNYDIGFHFGSTKDLYEFEKPLLKDKNVVVNVDDICGDDNITRIIVLIMKKNQARLLISTEEDILEF